MGRLTVAQLDAMFEESSRAIERKIRRQARWVSLLMNATGNYKEPVTVDNLVGGPDGKQQLDEAAIRKRAEARRQERLRERKQKG